jgi:hypothetical protein
MKRTDERPSDLHASPVPTGLALPVKKAGQTRRGE